MPDSFIHSYLPICSADFGQKHDFVNIIVYCPPHYDVGALSVSCFSSISSLFCSLSEERAAMFNQAVDGGGEFSTPAELGEWKSCKTANTSNSCSGVSGYITFTWEQFVITLAAQCRILKSLHCWPKFLQPNANGSTAHHPENTRVLLFVSSSRVMDTRSAEAWLVEVQQHWCCHLEQSQLNFCFAVLDHLSTF